MHTQSIYVKVGPLPYARHRAAFHQTANADVLLYGRMISWVQYAVLGIFCAIGLAYLVLLVGASVADIFILLAL